MIRKIIKPQFQILKAKRVAAYARVSVETERTAHSLANQVSYFSSLIQSTPGWEYAGVYADEGISGTGIKKRDGFNRMMADAEAGKIDIILTKSIQRFARNTVDLLKAVRRLKELGVEVRFEKEHLNTLSGDGELMLTLLASIAQEESISISNNIKWAFRKKIQQGIPHSHFFVYGYHWEGDILVPTPEEAEAVRQVFQYFLAGKSYDEIADELTKAGCQTFYGHKRFTKKGISDMLQNPVYTGKLLLQKGFVDSPLTKNYKVNQGELPRYLVSNDHEAIVDEAAFDRVQELIKRKRELGFKANKSLHLSPLSGLIKCPYCHCSYVHLFRNNHKGYWVCGTKKKKGGHCPVKGSLPDAALLEITNPFLPAIERIEVPDYRTIKVFTKDGQYNMYKLKEA